MKGYDKKKRWGNSAQKGHGVNSPAMMEARKNIAKKMAKKKHIEAYLDNFIKHGKEKSDEKVWKYARENRLSDKRIF